MQICGGRPNGSANNNQTGECVQCKSAGAGLTALQTTTRQGNVGSANLWGHFLKGKLCTPSRDVDARTCSSQWGQGQGQGCNKKKASRQCSLSRGEYEKEGTQVAWSKWVPNTVVNWVCYVDSYTRKALQSGNKVCMDTTLTDRAEPRLIKERWKGGLTRACINSTVHHRKRDDH
jgi:hypothetical protein